jgi:hypothetical protein
MYKSRNKISLFYENEVRKLRDRNVDQDVARHTLNREYKITENGCTWNEMRGNGLCGCVREERGLN